MLALLARKLLVLVAHLAAAPRAIWAGCAPGDVQRVYYANHASHVDFWIIWASLPPALRRRTRPVVGADYWLQGPIRAYVAREVLHAVLIQRGTAQSRRDPIEVIAEAVDQGSSLIVFPEGTRNVGDEKLLPFRSGIYFLAKARPRLEFVPVWLENLNRVMPKGEFIPVPLLCTATFGAPVVLAEGESRDAFVARTRAALAALAPPEGR